MKGENATIEVSRFGSINVIVERIVHGISIIAYGYYGTGEGPSSRRGRAFYMSKRTSGSFVLSLVFPSYGDYVRTMDWFESYARWATNPHATPSPMLVTVPSRNFSKSGIVENGITFGDQVGSKAYRVALNFMGASEPLDHDDPAISRVIHDKTRDDRGDPTLFRIYPPGNMMAGLWSEFGEAGEGGQFGYPETISPEDLMEKLGGG